VVAAVLANGDENRKTATQAALKLIEQGFPVSAFGGDAATNVNAIHQTEANPREFLAHLEAVLPLMLAEANGDFAELVRQLQTAEPYSLNWKLTKEFLIKKGWINGET
jgi:hypothetical protein